MKRMKRMKDKSLPLKKGETIDLQISGMTHGGDGVGRFRGLAVFVPGTVPGDTILAEVVDLKRNYARGRLLEITGCSPGRCEPECANFSTCGGCRLQHVDYTEQLKLKTGLVRDSLARIAGLHEAAVHATLGMNQPWHYRNKAHFQVEERDGKFKLGFYEEGSHKLTAFFNDSLHSGCLLVARELNGLASVIENLLNKHGGPPEITGKQSPFFRHIVLRRAFDTGEMMAVLVTGSRKWSQEKAFVRDLMSLQPDLTSLVRSINDGLAGVVLGRENRVLAGQKCITDKLGDLTFRISPSSFYQVNPEQTLVLYRKALEYASLTGVETVVDAYCGIGTIALFLAGYAKKVHGVEAVSGAVKDARSNALLNKIDNVEFLTGEVEKLLPNLAAGGFNPDLVVLDPPRRGCARETLDAVVEMRTPRVVYVSCNPGTLARDIGYLTEKGYSLKEVQPVDMFPWTAHVEAAVLLQRVER